MAAAKKKSSKGSSKKKARAEQAAPAIAEQSTGQGQALTPWQEMDRLFEDFLDRRLPGMFGREWPRFGEWPKWGRLTNMLGERFPAIDVVDRDGEIVVRAEVPGIEKKDLDVSVSDRTLSIKGSSRTETKDESGDYHRHEIRSGSFSRSVQLPADVDASGAKAKFKDGVVELALPKRPGAKRQKITVS